MFDRAQIDGVSLDHHHHICCQVMFHPCPLGPDLLVLMSDKNVLGLRKTQLAPQWQ